MLRNLLIIFAIISSAQTSADTKPLAPEGIPGAVVLSANEVVELILNTPGLVIIDSRKQQEYTKGHIEGAISLLDTYMKMEELERIAPAKSSPILFYCNGIRCMRSSNAIAKAIDWGYTNLYWFRGGWKEWQQNRLPIVSGEYKYQTSSPEHQ